MDNKFELPDTSITIVLGGEKQVEVNEDQVELALFINDVRSQFEQGEELQAFVAIAAALSERWVEKLQGDRVTVGSVVHLMKKVAPSLDLLKKK